MAAMTDYISEINSKLMYWKLKVRIVRLWENTDRDRPDCPFSIEVILMDEKGDRIHASLGRSLFPNFRESIKEMGLYFIKNFVVCPNTMKLRIKDHKFKLMFTKKTVIEEIEDPHFNQISVKNTWHVSKLYINSSLPQVDEFSSRIKFVPGESSQRLTQISSQRNQSIATELASGSVTVHEIEKLIDCRHPANNVQKVLMKWGTNYTVDNVVFVESVIRRYKLKIRVWDDTGTISVMLWDGVATKMIEKSATDLFESSDGQGQDEVFKVVTFTDDEDIIEKYRPPPRGETFKDPDFNDNQVSLDDREFMDSTEDTKLINVSQTPNKIKKIDAATVVEEDPNSQLSGNKIKRVFKKKKTT
ncbi:hypothetical protein KY290_003839 [Solanum tuberosum]|uniref:Replication protein A 70 kDa DNA-binding subunit B/D first OB fold domain-containing protein n=1 Tax=Solanum tuberosum TaxID=4113 RepID=A0ABQ7WU09_SOLTU|nr:hypothetical protein KY290_003839 [Solanum tuberosum]